MYDMPRWGVSIFLMEALAGFQQKLAELEKAEDELEASLTKEGFEI